MKLTKEQLEILSECIYNQMNHIGNTRTTTKGLINSIKRELKKLQELNHIICNELERIDK